MITQEPRKRLIAIKSQLEAALKNTNSALAEPFVEERKFPPLLEGDKADIVIEEICRYARITHADLMERARYAPLLTFRKIACYLLIDFCGLTQQATANKLNLDNHATAKSHADKMRWWMNNRKHAPHDTIIATLNIIDNLKL